MKIKIIDLLNMISKEEEVPKKIKFASQIWQKENGGRNNIYYVNDVSYDLFVVIFRSNGAYSINDEIELIEEDEEIEYKPIQELKNRRFTRNQKQIAGKINELIKAVNELKKGK